MRNYEVTWTMDFVADTPESAATQALQFVRGTQVPLVFLVKDRKLALEIIIDTEHKPPKRI